MGKVGFHTLAVIHAAVANSLAGSSNHDVATATANVSVPVLGNFVDDLVKGREDVISKLHLSDCRIACSGEAHSHAGNGLLAEWCVQHTVLAELVTQAHRASEDEMLEIIAQTKDDARNLTSSIDAVEDMDEVLLPWLHQEEMLFDVFRQADGSLEHRNTPSQWALFLDLRAILRPIAMVAAIAAALFSMKGQGQAMLAARSYEESQSLPSWSRQPSTGRPPLCVMPIPHSEIDCS
mmetsp:Transcript_27928/g.59489  ORF Transcript_27928/g.59489 Transcript_27928/m.59489 type:complete len:236 (-) Transcript_27928:25-732(-)